MSRARDELTVQAWAAMKGATWGILSRIRGSTPEAGAQPGHMGFLHALSEAQRPLTPTELAGCLGVTPATVTGAVTTLEELGLVERKRPADDRRAVHVSITPKGRAVQRAWHDTLRRHIDESLAPLTDAELRMLADVLARVATPIHGPPREMMALLRHDPPAPAKRGAAKRRRRADE